MKIKLCLSAALICTPTFTFAGINVFDNEQGHLSIGGNAEFNINYQNRESNNGDDEYNQDGRILIEFSGEKHLSNGHFVAIKAQPLFKSTGDVNLDDAYFELGKENAWTIKIGRYEAYDMFPVGLDVFLEYSGNTANDLYHDGAAYSYQMKEARGRGADGQLMYFQSFDNLYFELSTMLGDRSNLFSGSEDNKFYHGKKITETKDSFLVRPVLAYKVDNFKVSISMETNLVSNAAVDEDGTDISDRTGYGLTANWSNDDFSINFNTAYMDAVNETNFSTGLNAVWGGFGLGYVYSLNTYDDVTWADGDIDVSTIYTSYAFSDVLEIKHFSILLGAYYTSVSNHLDTKSINASFNEDDDTGFRVRFYYKF